jgi:ketosteroid isomerase-like protein
MVRMKHGLVAVVILTTGIVAAVHFSETEEKKVRRQFALLSQSVSKDSGETILTATQKIRRIASSVAESCTFRAEVISLSGTYTPDEISIYATQARSQFSGLSLRFHDLDIEVLGTEVANVVFTARLTGTTRFGEAVDETREVESVLKKIDNEWLFTNVAVIEVLER